MSCSYKIKSDLGNSSNTTLINFELIRIILFNSSENGEY